MNTSRTKMLRAEAIAGAEKLGNAVEAFIQEAEARAPTRQLFGQARTILDLAGLLISRAATLDEAQAEANATPKKRAAKRKPKVPTKHARRRGRRRKRALAIRHGAVEVSARSQVLRRRAAKEGNV